MEYKTDSLLVHLARAGDEDACEKLVKKLLLKHISILFAIYLWSLWGKGFDTRSIYTFLFKFIEYGKVKNYLYTIAGNTVKNL